MNLVKSSLFFAFLSRNDKVSAPKYLKWINDDKKKSTKTTWPQKVLKKKSNFISPNVVGLFVVKEAGVVTVHLVQVGADRPPQGFEQVAEAPERPLDRVGILQLDAGCGQDGRKVAQMRVELLLQVCSKSCEKTGHQSYT